MTIDSSWDEVCAIEGIGGRRVWEINPNQDNWVIWALMCPRCGRIYEEMEDEAPDGWRGFVWHQIDRVDPMTMAPITESVGSPPDIPLFFVSGSQPEAMYGYQQVFQTIEAHTMELGVLALLCRSDLTDKDLYADLPYYCVAFFEHIEGIGGRKIIDWNSATISRPFRESVSRGWMQELIGMDESAWIGFTWSEKTKLEPRDTMPERLTEDDQSAIDEIDIPKYFVSDRKETYPMVFETAEAYEVGGVNDRSGFNPSHAVVAMLRRLDIGGPNSPYYNLAFFTKEEGIGGRSFYNWNQAHLSRAHSKLAIQDWMTSIVDMVPSAWQEISYHKVQSLTPMDSLPVMEADEAYKNSDEGFYHCVCGALAYQWVSVEKVEGIGGREMWEQMAPGHIGDTWRCICGRIYAWTKIGNGPKHKLMTIDESEDQDIPLEFIYDSRREGHWHRWSRWRILRHFESPDGMWVLCERRDQNKYGALAYIGLFPGIEGIGGRTTVDRTKVYLSSASRSATALEPHFMRIVNAYEETGTTPYLNYITKVGEIPVSFTHEIVEDIEPEERNLVVSYGALFCQYCNSVEEISHAILKHLLYYARPIMGIGERIVGWERGRNPDNKLDTICCIGCKRVYSMNPPYPVVGRLTESTERKDIVEKKIEGIDEYIRWDENGYTCACGANDEWPNVRVGFGIGGRDTGWERAHEDTDHIMCSHCGRIYDFIDDAMPRIDQTDPSRVDASYPTRGAN